MKEASVLHLLCSAVILLVLVLLVGPICRDTVSALAYFLAR